MTIHTISQNILKFPDQILDQKRKKNTIKFTDLSIKHLKPRKTRTIFWCEGMTEFGIRISPKGGKSWVYEYRFDGKGRRITLGKYPKVSLAKATKLFSQARIDVSNATDPLIKRHDEKKKYDEQLTVNELSEEYIKFCMANGEKAWKEKQRVIQKELLPIIGHLKTHEVTFRHIAQIINAVHIGRSAPVQAQRLLSHARCMFKYAKNSLGLVEVNPCADLEAPKRAKTRKRALNTREIYLFWYNIDYTLMTPVVRLGLKFMLCTMARGIEVRKMKWSDVNFKDKTWFIPSENAKNGREILLPLNTYALEVLKEVRDLTGHSALVFGHHVTMNYGQLKKDYELSIMGTTAFSHAVRDNFDLFCVGEKFTPHDLRRTMATCLTSVSYPKEWVSKLLNHTPKDITGMVYDVFDYFEEKRAGMESIKYILDRILSAKSIDLVPSLRAIRKEFLSQKLIYQFLDEAYYDPQKIVDTQQEFQASLSSPVLYKLSYAHDGSKKPI